MNQPEPNLNASDCTTPSWWDQMSATFSPQISVQTERRDTDSVPAVVFGASALLVFCGILMLSFLLPGLILAAPCGIVLFPGVMSVLGIIHSIRVLKYQEKKGRGIAGLVLSSLFLAYCIYLFFFLDFSPHRHHPSILGTRNKAQEEKGADIYSLNVAPSWVEDIVAWSPLLF